MALGPRIARSSGFVFGGGGGGGDTAAPGLVDVEGCSPTLASSWSSSSFVFGASDTRSSFSFGSSKAAPSSSFSATVGELTIDDPRNRQGDVDVSGGNGSLPEMITDSVLSPNFVRQEIDHRDEGLGAPSQTMGRESTESSCSLVGQVDRPSLCTTENVATQFAKDEGKISADGADSRESKSVFVFGENSEERGFTTKITETEIKKGDSVEKKIVAFGSDQLDASVAEGNACTESSFQGERHGCGSRMRDHRGVSTRAKASNALPFGLVVQDSGAKVSSTKLSDERRSAGVRTSELGDLGLVDEQSFTVHDNDAASREYGGVKGVSMNKRAVQQEKFSAHQVPLPLFISDQKAAPEVNLHLKEVTNFRLEDSDISKGNSGTKEEDVNCFSPQATESNHDRTVFISVTNLENSSRSDFIFAASTDHSKLHSQRRPSKKKIGGMSNHANSVESHQSSAIGLAHSEISRQQYTDLPAQWTKYNKTDPKTVTVSVGPAIKENIGHQEDCETWRIRFSNQPLSLVTGFLIIHVLACIPIPFQ